jgi:hypothetical protein
MLLVLATMPILFVNEGRAAESPQLIPDYGAGRCYALTLATTIR